VWAWRALEFRGMLILKVGSKIESRRGPHVERDRGEVVPFGKFQKRLSKLLAVLGKAEGAPFAPRRGVLPHLERLDFGEASGWVLGIFLHCTRLVRVVSAQCFRLGAIVSEGGRESTLLLLPGFTLGGFGLRRERDIAGDGVPWSVALPRTQPAQEREREVSRKAAPSPQRW